MDRDTSRDFRFSGASNRMDSDDDTKGSPGAESDVHADRDRTELKCCICKSWFPDAVEVTEALGLGSTTRNKAGDRTKRLPCSCAVER